MRADTNQRFSDLKEEANRRFDGLEEDVKEIKSLLVEFLKKEAHFQTP